MLYLFILYIHVQIFSKFFLSLFVRYIKTLLLRGSLGAIDVLMVETTSCVKCKVRLRTIHQKMLESPGPCTCGSFSAPGCPFFVYKHYSMINAMLFLLSYMQILRIFPMVSCEITSITIFSFKYYQHLLYLIHYTVVSTKFNVHF